MNDSQAPLRLKATAEAVALLRRLRGSHGALMIHQSGGCCDGSAPMCYPTGEFLVGDCDVLLAVLDLRLDVGQVSPDRADAVDAVPVWISGPQFAAWKHTQMILDVVPGRGSGFSLESPEGLRFISRGRALTDSEAAALASEEPVTGKQWRSGCRPPLPAVSQIVAEAADACPVPNRPA
ncbi:DUF779 domain-containing protein [Prescottella agglutinans]|uniref:Uncharacterized protein (DUF779 family) n=1 Tax=Prescottella agglutinans TaxID=1644129 RepID=A0ABT6M626_9NOCA|nr:DUF779 domain-containing protein [Prescottella agglutinans]MDH6279750.1 uncharacterized protein (DUF779 family) [Prescottella agglutinans]